MFVTTGLARKIRLIRIKYRRIGSIVIIFPGGTSFSSKRTHKRHGLKEENNDFNRTLAPSITKTQQWHYNFSAFRAPNSPITSFKSNPPRPLSSLLDEPEYPVNVIFITYAMISQRLDNQLKARAIVPSS